MFGAIFDFRFNICCRIRFFNRMFEFLHFYSTQKIAASCSYCFQKPKDYAKGRKKTVSKALKEVFFFFDKFGIVWSEAFLRKFRRNCFSFFEFLSLPENIFCSFLRTRDEKKELSSFSAKISDPCYLISRWTALGNVHRYPVVFLSLWSLVMFNSPHQVSKCMWHPKLQFLTLVC